MYALRRWSVRHARGLNTFYRGFEAVICALHPALLSAKTVQWTLPGLHPLVPAAQP